MSHPIKKILLSLLPLALLFLASCGEDEMPEPSYEIPVTYDFDHVSYSGQTQRLAMLSEMRAYMSSSREAGVAIDAARLQAMYANDAAGAQWNGTFEASKQLKDKTFFGVQADFAALLTALAEASQSTVAGTNGQAGVVVSNDGNKQYLLGANGLDHAQLIEKGLMGACLYYQATSVYFGADKMNVDNETVTPGEGTDMEHHWDEAFGYFGVPTSFPTDKDGVVFWGDYSVLRDPILGCNQQLMDALLKGRAAISAKDLDTRDEAITEARKVWEQIAVGSALHYLNDGISNFDDMALRGHSLSEGIGFIYALQFNEGKKITNAQVAELLEGVAGSADFASMNLYETTVARLQEAKDQLAAHYGLESKKDDF